MPLDTVFKSTTSPALLATNVIPGARKIAAESWAGNYELVDFYDPSDVQLNRVTGGFNSAVQIAASYSLRSYADYIGDVLVVARRRGTALAPDLESLKGKIADPWWSTLVLEPAVAYGIGFDLVPYIVAYSAGDVITIRLRGTISLMVAQDPFVPPRRPQPQPEPQPQIPVSLPIPVRSAISFVSPRESVKTTDVTEVTTPELATPMRVLHPIGTIEVILTATFESTEHVPQRSVDVWMNMDKAQITVKPEAGDATLFYDLFLAKKSYALSAAIAPSSRIPLTPTISLPGRNPANNRVDEFRDFETRVFSVTDRIKRQAICIAFDVVPGCKGIIEDVQHFIGGSDYGLIHDEYVVERILRDKWNRGGFDRSIALTNTVSLKVKRNGRDVTEDATVFGRLLLNTLDVIALLPHADLRTDVLSLGGQAEAVADQVLLIDGTVLTAANADLGATQATNWGVDIQATVIPNWEPDFELRDFKDQAHADGIRHLARPFSRFPLAVGTPEVQYTRTEAVQKRMFFIGQLPQVFV